MTIIILDPQIVEIDTSKERNEIYLLLKRAFTFAISMTLNEQLSDKNRFSWMRLANEFARTLRLYFNDEEKLKELKKRISKLENKYKRGHKTSRAL